MAEQRAMRAAQWDDLAARWRWFFVDCIIHDFRRQWARRRDLLNVSASVMAGLFGCGGPRWRWRWLEAPIGFLLGAVIGVGVTCGSLLHPLYRLRRARRERSLSKT